ncbi:hypothetical protein DICPUDRAFT_92069 [Dictyostelium purpureum]|uniref:Uncharacterized protein n=1 Tax=Dictyostelium purpureum TaxID=5786 RepID=F0ZLJ5_DICPU|nr:uncharacterized protein DICPUDRAFT_92069 [Dictyostelium purpureum]EGC35203.1 hypothetical protein DICPUDRAFT_92069 [Dictyostelium purpureum]|eukprot:XP_003288291.1 hypothetical protein DICPUDRAFT_92069 [Dictyostelium purpureum]
MNTSRIILSNTIRNHVAKRQLTTFTTASLSQVKGKDGKLYTVPPKKWEEGISTPSESIVKAERAPNMPIDELQKVSAAKFTTATHKKSFQLK